MDYTIEAFIQENLILVVIFASLLVALVLNEFKHFSKKYKEISPQEAVTLINRENALLLDLRESNEIVDEGFISNAMPMALSELHNAIGQISNAKERPIIAYCASGLRAASGCAILCRNGFSRVYNLKGGIAAWKQDSLPVQSNQAKS